MNIGFDASETETTELKRSTSELRKGIIEDYTRSQLLVDGLTMEEIRKGNISDSRNPLLAQKFKDIHFVETWGRGIRKILKLEPKAEFKEIGRMFYTTFLRPIGEPETGADRDVDQDVEKDVKKLNSTQLKIMELVEKNNKITARELSKKIGINHRNTQKVISELKQKGYLKRIGPPRGGHWEIIEEKEES